MNIDLYFAPFTRSTRPRWMLEELGVPYNLIGVDLKAGAHLTDNYRRDVHPLNVVPAMRVDGVPMLESGAMVGMLADRFADKGLAPALNNPQRAAYWQWIVFAAATLEPALVACTQTSALPDNDPTRISNEATMRRIWDVVEAGLGNQEHLLGAFQACDVIVGSTAIWAHSVKLLSHSHSLIAYVERLRQRPAYQRARKNP
jgi:glutathione S-transferase